MKITQVRLSNLIIMVFQSLSVVTREFLSPETLNMMV